MFSAPATGSASAAAPAPATTAGEPGSRPSGGGMILKKAIDMTGKWKCPICNCVTPITKKKCVACEAPAPGVTEEDLKREKQEVANKFGGGGGGTSGSIGAGSVFGGGDAGSVFGGGKFNFGGAATTGGETGGASSSSIFGAPPAGGSVFGAAPAAGGSIFGAAPSGGGSIFGAAPASGGGSIFGAGGTSTTGVFGSSQPTSTPDQGAGGASSSSASSASGGFVFDNASLRTSGGVGGFFPAASSLGGGASGPTANAGGKSDSPHSNVNPSNVQHAKAKVKPADKWDNLPRGKPEKGVNSGEVLIFGSGECEQLGLGDNVTEKKKPALLKQLSNKQVIKITAGGLHTLALCRGGRELYSWGCNDDGALGRARGSVENEPRLVEFDKGQISTRDFVLDGISAGDSHSCAKDVNGNVFLWGVFKDANGYVGFPDLNKFGDVLWRFDDDAGKKVPAVAQYPVEVKQLPPVKEIVSGADHVVALTKTGTIFSWGNNALGQLGQGELTPEQPAPSGDDAKDKENVDKFKAKKRSYLFPKPLVMPADDPLALRIGRAGDATYVVSKKFRTYGCGLNGDGQLGIGVCDEKRPCEPSLVEIKEFRGKQITCINGGQFHGVALETTSSSYTLYTWGRKIYTGLNMPGGKGAAAISAAVKNPLSNNGAAATNADNIISPVPIPHESFADQKIVDIVSGLYHVLAISDRGDVFAWGSGEMFQLGNSPKDVDNFTPEERDLEVGESEHVPRLIHASQLKDRFALAASGGGQHSVILAWDPSIKETFKRRAMSALAAAESFNIVVEQEADEQEAKAKVAKTTFPVFDSSAAAQNMNVEESKSSAPGAFPELQDEGSSGPLKLKSPPHEHIRTMKRSAEAINNDDDGRSPPRKRPKLVFSRDVVHQCLAEVEAFTRMKKSILKDPEIDMLDEV
ncbi:unnamed protein product [Amoebophrya sp. A25]|nr:unnamed protein product [Amoebophrya sp. A25]|eukprot:GSA25T00001610001.1